jgi:hypothetical protein
LFLTKDGAMRWSVSEIPSTGLGTLSVDDGESCLGRQLEFLSRKTTLESQPVLAFPIMLAVCLKPAPTSRTQRSPSNKLRSLCKCPRAVKIYGYRIPSTTNVYDPLYPEWLRTVTNLSTGLVTPGICQGAPSIEKTILPPTLDSLCQRSSRGWRSMSHGSGLLQCGWDFVSHPRQSWHHQLLLHRGKWF